jgi:hypothetical protein
VTVSIGVHVHCCGGRFREGGSAVDFGPVESARSRRAMATIARFEVQKWWHLKKNIDGRPIYKDCIEKCVNTIYVKFERRLLS